MDADMQVEVDSPHVEPAVEVFSMLAECVGKPATAVPLHLAEMRLGGMVAPRHGA